MTNNITDVLLAFFHRVVKNSNFLGLSGMSIQRKAKGRACHGRLAKPPKRKKQQTFKTATKRRVPLERNVGRSR
jgi:hypothetical protein